MVSGDPWQLLPFECCCHSWQLSGAPYPRLHLCPVRLSDLLKNLCYRGYQQIPVAEADICNTAISTPFRLFEFIHMPLVLQNAGQTFQQTMDMTIRGLEEIFYYLDDMLVVSASLGEHSIHLKALFDCLQANSSIVCPEKYVFGWVDQTFEDIMSSHLKFAPYLSRLNSCQIS